MSIPATRYASGLHSCTKHIFSIKWAMQIVTPKKIAATLISFSVAQKKGLFTAKL